MKFEYDYHIKVDGKVIFLGAELKIQMINSQDKRNTVLKKIGPKGIYVKFPNLNNIQFLNFNNIESIEEV